jgi:ABC-type multidrug transport system ATPase subunit
MGLIGDNGAGKTTLFGVVSGAVRPDGGRVDVLGQGPFRPGVHRGRLSVLPQDCALHPHSSAEQLLTHLARLQGMTLREAKKDAHRVLDLMRLTDRRASRVRQLSHGMKRRLAVAQALLGDPELVLLDEPTAGLDPQLVVEMRELLAEQRGQRTLVVSSHILSDLEAICDHVAFLKEGRCETSGTVDEVTRRDRVVRVSVTLPCPEERFVEVLEGRDPKLVDDELRFAIHPDEDRGETISRLLAELIDAGVRLTEVRLGESLEATYLRVR